MFEKMRERWTKAISPLVYRMDGFEPSTLTWTSLILSLLAFYLLMTAERNTDGAIHIVEGVVIILLAGILDGLDGALARHQGTDGPYGDFLDHTIDRIVDVGIHGHCTFQQEIKLDEVIASDTRVGCSSAFVLLQKVIDHCGSKLALSVKYVVSSTDGFACAAGIVDVLQSAAPSVQWCGFRALLCP